MLQHSNQLICFHDSFSFDSKYNTMCHVSNSPGAFRSCWLVFDT